ncbi:solute carrier organic anion transporter family member 4A1-like isoform X2 [Apostichopus japonicus]
MTSNTGHSSDDGGVDFHKAKSREKNEVDEFAEDLSKDEEEEDDETTCGWLGIRPSCIQGCNRSSVFLVFWCGLALFQSTTVNGLVYVVTTTLERRFSLPSAQSGAISSTYDFTVLVLIVFVTYLTERIHKPLLLGGGAIVFALGSYVFTLPHFLAPNHSIGAIEGGEVCHVNGTAVKCNEESGGSLSGFYWYFVAGQVLHGIGSCPIYTHGRIYIYENVRAQVVPIYFAILQLLSSLGIAVGFLFGGVLLQMYTDLQTDVSTLEIDPSSPIWIGNWWIGFIIVGTLSLLISIPLAGFPKYIKGTSAIRKANDEFTRPQKGSEFYATRGVSGLVKDFPRAMWNLIKNIPLMCINFGIAAEFFIISCTTVFGPKYMETQFNLQASTAAVMAGAIVVPSSIIGVLLGGWIIKKFNLQYTGQARLCCVALLASLILLVAFLIGCPNVDFAGVTAPYDNGGSELGQDVVMNITDSCNKHCQCIDSFAPVCGSNDVMYYSACHAGCSSFEIVNGTKMYVDCECISATSGSPGLRGIANPGRCSLDDCFRPYIFFGLTLFLVICSSMVLVPSQTMLLGVVSPSQRTTATGLGSLMFRAFGSVPGPIILGTIIDNVCLVWEYDCDGGKTCWMYENKRFANSAFVVLVVCRSLSLLFFIGALFSYRPSEDTTPIDRKVQSTENA